MATPVRGKIAGARRVAKDIRLRCPFRAENPDRYKDVMKHCTEQQSFPGCDRLNEHIKRYHSWTYWCIVCKKNFAAQSGKTIHQISRAGKSPQIGSITGGGGGTDLAQPGHACEPREWTKQEELASHTWMSEEQERRWMAWHTVPCEPGGGNIQERNWKKIYLSIFPNAAIVPEPQHKSIMSSAAVKPNPNGDPISSSETSISHVPPTPKRVKHNTRPEVDEDHSERATPQAEPVRDDRAQSDMPGQALMPFSRGDEADDVPIGQQQQRTNAFDVWSVNPNDTIAYSSPYSADRTHDELRQRDARVNQQDWAERLPDLDPMVSSATDTTQSDRVPPYFSQEHPGMYAQSSSSDIFGLNQDKSFDVNWCDPSLGINDFMTEEVSDD